MTRHPILTQQQRINRRNALKKRDGDRCARCGWFGIQLTLDHIIPWSMGGNNEVQNLQLLCTQCNALKADKIADYRVAA